MKIPKAEHHIGDAVSVAIEEAGCPPSFDARVCGIQLNRHGQIEYEVVEDNGTRSDGYTERWLTAKAPKTKLSDRRPNNMKSYIEDPGDCYTTTAKAKRPKPVRWSAAVRCVAWIALAWGVIGGWSIVGGWWPQLNKLTKDQVTIIAAIALLWSCRKQESI